MLKFVEISSSFLIILRIVSIFLGRGLDGGKGVNKLKKIKSVNICDAIFLLRRLDSRGFSKICTLLPFWFIGVVRQGFEGLVDLFVFATRCGSVERLAAADRRPRRARSNRKLGNATNRLADEHECGKSGLVWCVCRAERPRRGCSSGVGLVR